MVYAHTLLFYHLHLSHILSASHFNEAQDLSGSEAAQDLESMEDATDGVLRALKKSSSDKCKKNNDCGSGERCNSNDKCVRRNRARKSIMMYLTIVSNAHSLTDHIIL